MTSDLRFTRLDTLPEDFFALRAESEAEGFRFLRRMQREWAEGTNRFSEPGECLWGAFQAGALVGCGGLNRDPYVGVAGAGRLRHLYVMRGARRQGIASALIGRLEASARGHFALLRLRTDTEQAARFYLRHGYRPVAEEAASHVKWLADPADQLFGK